MKKVLVAGLSLSLLLGACTPEQEPTKNSKKSDVEIIKCGPKDVDGKKAKTTGEFIIVVTNSQGSMQEYIVKFDVRDAHSKYLASGTIRIQNIPKGATETGETDLPIGSSYKEPFICNIKEVK